MQNAWLCFRASSDSSGKIQVLRFRGLSGKIQVFGFRVLGFWHSFSKLLGSNSFRGSVAPNLGEFPHVRKGCMTQCSHTLSQTLPLERHTDPGSHIFGPSYLLQKTRSITVRDHVHLTKRAKKHNRKTLKSRSGERKADAPRPFSSTRAGTGENLPI